MELVFPFFRKMRIANRGAVWYIGRRMTAIFTSPPLPRTEWQRGMVRFDTETEEMETLLIDDRLYSDWNFAEDADRLVFERADGNRPAEVFVSNYELNDLRRLTGFSDLARWSMPSLKPNLFNIWTWMPTPFMAYCTTPPTMRKERSIRLIAYIYEDFLLTIRFNGTG